MEDKSKRECPDCGKEFLPHEWYWQRCGRCGWHGTFPVAFERTKKDTRQINALEAMARWNRKVKAN